MRSRSTYAEAGTHGADDVLCATLVSFFEHIDVLVVVRRDKQNGSAARRGRHLISDK
jgi:hypothetical protein